MTARRPYTVASVRYALNVARKLGLRVTGLRLDGVLLVEDGPPIVAPTGELSEIAIPDIWDNVKA
jgi:hypothetical protein